MARNHLVLPNFGHSQESTSIGPTGHLKAGQENLGRGSPPQRNVNFSSWFLQDPTKRSNTSRDWVSFFGDPPKNVFFQETKPNQKGGSDKRPSHLSARGLLSPNARRGPWKPLPPAPASPGKHLYLSRPEAGNSYDLPPKGSCPTTHFSGNVPVKIQTWIRRLPGENGVCPNSFR